MLAIRNKKLFLFVIMLVCITSFVSAELTWRTLYAALDAFLNGKGIWETVNGQIKSLEDQIKDLEKKRDEENEAEQSDNASILYNMGRVSEQKKKIKEREQTLSEATSDKNSKHSSWQSAITAYKTSVDNEKQAKKAYKDFRKMCGNDRYCEPDCYYCNEHNRLYEAWQQCKRKSAQDKKARDDAYSEYVKAYNWEESVKKNLNSLKLELNRYDGLVKYYDKARQVHIAESKRNDAILKEKNAELERRKTRRDQLEIEKPTVRLYMDNIVAAYDAPDFDFQEYIKANPPPEIIFATE